MDERKLTLICPSGVGDVAWIINALWSVRSEIERIDILEGWPHRTREFVECCGFVSDYVPLSYDMIQTFERAHGYFYTQTPTWERVRAIEAATIPIEANKHLEAGKPLATWMRDLIPEYHPPMHVDADVRARTVAYADRAMRAHPMGADGPVVGISCASYRGAEAWKTWQLDEWKDMCRRIMSIGWRPLLIGGQWDDLTFALACDLGLPELVGKTPAGSGMIAICDYVDAYIGFSSGLNVVRTMLNKPALALWPEHQIELSWSWAPPAMLDSNRYVASRWLTPQQVWPVAKAFLRLCERERANGGLTLAHANAAIDVNGGVKGELS